VTINEIRNVLRRQAASPVVLVAALISIFVVRAPVAMIFRE
jgi:hypothetical protein